MAENQGYNGWSNYETWLVNLWLNGEPGGYALLEEALAEGGDDLYSAADWLSDRLSGDLAGVDLPGMLRDLVGAAFGRVNWVEIVSGV